jgi:hypothetical protein
VCWHGFCYYRFEVKNGIVLQEKTLKTEGFVVVSHDLTQQMPKFVEKSKHLQS